MTILVVELLDALFLVQRNFNQNAINKQLPLFLFLSANLLSRQRIQTVLITVWQKGENVLICTPAFYSFPETLKHKNIRQIGKQNMNCRDTVQNIDFMQLFHTSALNVSPARFSTNYCFPFPALVETTRIDLILDIYLRFQYTHYLRPKS